MCVAATLDVLVVKDDALLLYSIAHALRGEGWLVLEARTGAEAIAHLDASRLPPARESPGAPCNTTEERPTTQGRRFSASVQLAVSFTLGCDLLAILHEVAPDRSKLRDVTVGAGLPFFGDHLGPRAILFGGKHACP